MYCNVLILDIVHSSLDKPFTYGIPENLINIISTGSLVEVNFRGQIDKALVVSKTNAPDLEDEKKIKNINSLSYSKPVISPELLELSYWMRKYYLCPASKILNTMLPRGLLIDYSSKYDKFVKLNYHHLDWSLINTSYLSFF